MGITVDGSDSLAEASRHLKDREGIVTLMDDAGHAARTITTSDIEHVTLLDPKRWQARRCRDLDPSGDAWVWLDDPFEEVVWQDQHGEIRPLLIFNGKDVVRLLQPSAVLQWCAEHLPTALPPGRYTTLWGTTHSRWHSAVESLYSSTSLDRRFTEPSNARQQHRQPGPWPSRLRDSR